MSESATTGKAHGKPRAPARIALPQILSAFILIVAVANGISEICLATLELLLGPLSEREALWTNGLCSLAVILVGFRVAKRTWAAPRYEFLLRPKPGSLVFAFRWWSGGWRLLGLALLCSFVSSIAAAFAFRGLSLPEGPAGDILFGVMKILFLAVLILAVLGVTARRLRGTQVVPQS